MFTFIKQLFGFDKPTMKDAGVQLEQAPYKVPEPAATTPIPLVVETAPVIEPVLAPVVESVTAPVVEAAPAKKPRKPRAPKVVVETVKVATKKAAPVKKAAAMKAAPRKPTTPRSKKV
jgi:hypothetical protein